MQNTSVRNQDPKILWNHFADINAVPRASKKEERIIAFMVEFGNKLGLETLVDPAGNVIIKKPATPGMENRKPVVLQSHLDMVHQKNNDVDFDFNTQGIKMYVDGDWVKADGTTLGADNGLGVAAIMSVLSGSDIAHPALEALFTIDEETGMTGAKGLQAGYLEGEILLNLDTEEEDEIDIGCAGGIDVTMTKAYDPVAPGAHDQGLQISVKGLQGGHSGMDIHKGLGNANMIMNRIISQLHPMVRISEIEGGGLRNAIPRESVAILTCKTSDIPAVKQSFELVAQELKQEFAGVEPGLNCTLSEVSAPSEMISLSVQENLLKSISDAVNGVYKMSEDIEDLVEASNNIARVEVGKGQITILCLTRSSVEKSKMEVVDSLKDSFSSGGFQISLSGEYPGWSPNKDSAILKVLENIYEEMFGNKPSVVACHAGLECGILGSNYPEMDMISFGPTIKGAHSPDERACISSTSRFWKFLQEILKNIPEKQV